MKRLALLVAAAMAFPAAQATPPAATTPPSPEARWKAEIAQNDAGYATDKHAILKVNDAAYVRSGESISLVGKPGQPDSWKWMEGQRTGAALVASYSDGRTVITRAGKQVPASELEKGIDIAPYVDVAGAPTQIAPGETGLRIMVYNQQSKAAKAFKGLSYFPYDPAFRVMAAFKPDTSLTPHVFRTSRGLDKQFYHAGDASFMLKGKSVTLPFYTESTVAAKITTMTSFFTDDLTGKGAYHAGRYVDVDGSGKYPPKTITIDFNNAYNPNCARSPFYNCPFAVDNVPLAIRAGEKDPHAP